MGSHLLNSLPSRAVLIVLACEVVACVSKRTRYSKMVARGVDVSSESGEDSVTAAVTVGALKHEKVDDHPQISNPVQYEASAVEQGVEVSSFSDDDSGVAAAVTVEALKRDRCTSEGQACNDGGTCFEYRNPYTGKKQLGCRKRKSSGTRGDRCKREGQLCNNGGKCVKYRNPYNGKETLGCGKSSGSQGGINEGFQGDPIYHYRA